MASQIWQDSLALRNQLPRLAAFGEPLPLGIDEYRTFYNLNFSVDHQYHIGTFASDQFTLVGQIFQPPRPQGTLFVYHGYFDHLGLYRFVIELGLELGFTVVGFDLPGHGLSSGLPASIECFSQYATAQWHFMQQLNHFPERVPQRWSALGQSTGAAVIIDSLLEAKRSNVDHVHYSGGLVLLAPLIRPHNWYWVRILYQVLRHRGSTPRAFSRNSANQQFIDFIRDKDPLQHQAVEALWVGAMICYAKRIIVAEQSKLAPLVIQGTADTTVDFRFNLKQLAQLFDQPEIMMLKNARHHLVNESEEFRKPIKARIKSYLAQFIEV